MRKKDIVRRSARADLSRMVAATVGLVVLVSVSAVERTAALRTEETTWEGTRYALGGSGLMGPRAENAADAYPELIRLLDRSVSPGGPVTRVCCEGRSSRPRSLEGGPLAGMCFGGAAFPGCSCEECVVNQKGR